MFPEKCKIIRRVSSKVIDIKLSECKYLSGFSYKFLKSTFVKKLKSAVWFHLFKSDSSTTFDLPNRNFPVTTKLKYSNNEESVNVPTSKSKLSLIRINFFYTKITKTV